MPRAEYTIRLHWLHGGPRMIEHCQTEAEAKTTLTDWLARFAGVKFATLADPEAKHTYDARGKYLFTMPR